MSNNDSSGTEEDGRTGVGRTMGRRVRSPCQKATINSPLLNSPFFSRPPPPGNGIVGLRPLHPSVFFLPRGDGGDSLLFASGSIRGFLFL